MSLSSFCVVSNALRLNFTKIYSESKDQKMNDISIPAAKTENRVEEEKRMMTKTLKIGGMMCPHCEAHVKKALEAMEGVKEAVANHADNQATVILEKEIAEEEFRKVVPFIYVDCYMHPLMVAAKEFIRREDLY